MAIKIFLDTNIILDILDDKRPFHSTAVKLYGKIEAGEVNGFISESVLTTTDYILQKVATKETRISMISHLLDFFNILPCNNDISLKAISSNFSDFEDAVLHQIAVSGSMEFFITNDIKALKSLAHAALPVISSNDFLNINK